MSKFYSKETGGFYDSGINATMPPDAVAVTDEAYAALFAAQASGSTIGADANGNPIVVAPVQPSAAQIAQQQGQAALANGLTISSANFPALNGTYSLSQNSLINLTGITAYIGLKSAFPTGSTLTWYDESGTAHVFTSTAEFEAFAEAIAGYVTQVQDYMLAGSGSLPASTVTIP